MIQFYAPRPTAPLGTFYIHVSWPSLLAAIVTVAIGWWWLKREFGW